MKLVTVLLVFVCSPFVAGQAGAETWSKQLTRDDTSDQMYTFAISAEPLERTRNLAEIDAVGRFLQFNVTVKPVASPAQLKEARQQGWRPHYSGELRVFNGKKFISACKVQPTRRDEELSFSFEVAAEYAEKSGFTFAQTEAEDAGRISYWFYLKDFVESE